MRIKILKIAEHSAHFNQPYSLVGATGDVDVMDARDNYTYFELSNCKYPIQSPEFGSVDGQPICAYIESYEIVNEL